MTEKGLQVGVETHAKFVNFLLAQCSSMKLEIIAHALNAFYDVYSEDDFNKVFLE